MHPLAELLTPGRVVCRVPDSSKKRLFETIARIIGEDQVSLPQNQVLTSLIAREKLGSTGLGQGIAIPHCRIDNCTHALGTLVTTEHPVTYDAPDDVPVDILFVLLVPGEAHQQHLDILASVAGLFSQEDFCRQIRAADTSQSLFDIATTWTT